MVLPQTYPQPPPPCADEPMIVSPYAPSLPLQNPDVLFQRDVFRPSAATPHSHARHALPGSYPAPHATQPTQRPTQSEDKQSYRQPVYVVRCAHCDSFFTDRGMRALLLLKPNVSLFSTDAIPNNCSAVYAPEAMLGQEADPESPKQRTCTCLTQTLGCHGCGSVVGYHVVSPCNRCSTNVARHTRSSNGYVLICLLCCSYLRCCERSRLVPRVLKREREREREKRGKANTYAVCCPWNSHRIVFHCTEISTHERRYVPGDRGVKAMQVPLRLEELLQKQRTLSSYVQHVQQSGELSPSLGLRKEDCAATTNDVHDVHDDVYNVQQVTHVLQAKLWATTQQIRMVYSLLVKQYNSGARIILRGEPIYWSDLHLEGGDRPRPFDPEEVLDPLSVLGR